MFMHAYQHLPLHPPIDTKIVSMIHLTETKQKCESGTKTKFKIEIYQSVKYSQFGE